MTKLFDVAGVSTLAGKTKFRVANGKPEARAKVLTRSGHTDINLVQLPSAMSKADALAYVKAQGMTAAEVKVRDVVAKAPKAKAPKAAAKAPKAAKAKPRKTAAKAPKAKAEPAVDAAVVEQSADDVAAALLSKLGLAA